MPVRDQSLKRLRNPAMFLWRASNLVAASLAKMMSSSGLVDFSSKSALHKKGAMMKADGTLIIWLGSSVSGAAGASVGFVSVTVDAATRLGLVLPLPLQPS